MANEHTVGALRHWSAADEKRLHERREEMEALEARRGAAITRIVDVFGMAGIDCGPIEKVIANAGELRDALEPFDSGVRAARDA